MKLTDFKALTFDCYGTLIDWEEGIYAALQPLLALGEHSLSRDQALEIYARHESAQQASMPGMLYSTLLATVHGQLATHWRIDAPDQMHTQFGSSVKDWPAFPDSVASLRYLANHYKLVILSNVDRMSFAGSNKRLEVSFDAIYTAQDVGSYKPASRNFEYMLDQLKADFGLGKEHVLHTAQSLFHDHEPAKRFGIANAWIDRRHDQTGWGATMPPAEQPEVDFQFSSMADLVKAHQSIIASS